MINEDRKILTLLTMLTKLTSEKKLVWEVAAPPNGVVAGTDDVVPLCFETQYKKQLIAIYERRYQEYSGDNDAFYWTGRITLAFLDNVRRNIWEHDDPSGPLINLFEIVRRSVANVDALLDELLSQNEEGN